jgi:hypothetical protein
MKRFIIGFIFLMAVIFLHSEGLQEVVEATNESARTSDLFYMKNGIEMGQKLFINVITEMEKNGETNYDIEYIVNNYVDYIASHTFLKSYETTYDWMRFITTTNILSFHYAFDTFFNLLELYLWKKEEMFLNNNSEDYD